MFGLETFLGTREAASALNLGTTLLSTWGATRKAGQESDFFSYQSDRLRELGSIEAGIGEVAASRARRMAKYNVGEVSSAYASGGIDVGSKSARNVTGEIAGRTELDALALLLEGNRKAYDYSVRADMVDKAGENARQSGRFASAGSLLGGLAREMDISRWGMKGDGVRVGDGAPSVDYVPDYLNVDALDYIG